MTMKYLFLLFLTLASATAQNAVLDTSGRPLRRGVQYYIKPAITDNGGRFTLVNRNGSCPLFVGQELTSLGRGLPVKFNPFYQNNNTVIEGIDFKVSFVASTICVTSNTWKLNGDFISAGSDTDSGYSSYFYISAGEVKRSYYINWCPDDACPGCRWLRCGTLGVVVENGKRLLVWVGRPSLPVVFERAKRYVN